MASSPGPPSYGGMGDVTPPQTSWGGREAYHPPMAPLFLGAAHLSPARGGR